MFDLSYEEEWLLHSQIANGIVYISLPIFITLYWIIPSPWGKTLAASDQKPAWWLGPLLPARISWFVFESPNLVWSYICWQQRRADLSVANVLLLVLFVLHYLRRAILYPATMSPETKPMPLAVVVSAFCFCACNGYVQAQALCQFQYYPLDYWYSAQFILGVVLFFCGARINWQVDGHLTRLRQQSAGYQIPVGSWFDVFGVSAPHYWGEMVQWIGFAVAANTSTAAVSFVVFTMANLVPRGAAHHAWYKQHFGDKYPVQRKAVIPYIW